MRRRGRRQPAAGGGRWRGALRLSGHAEQRLLPAEAAADLVNHLALRGHEMQAGDFISTGAASVPQPFSAGDYVRADFGALGVIEVAF